MWLIIMIIKTLNHLHSLSVWAAIEVNMEDRVEVLRGDTAQITCMFTSDEGIGGMTIQWSFVSFSKPDAQIHT